MEVGRDYACDGMLANDPLRDRLGRLTWHVLDDYVLFSVFY